jgi:adenosyl cobinamide kinase/adenosyl cobinamide phosphate guanylyltransferase
MMILKLQSKMKKVSNWEMRGHISQSQAGRIRHWLTTLEDAEQINWWLEEGIDDEEINDRVHDWLHRELEEAKINYDLEKEIANGRI